MGSPAEEYTSKNMENTTQRNADEQRGERTNLDDAKNMSRPGKPGDEKQNGLLDEGKEDGEISEQSQLDQRSRDEHHAQNKLSNLEAGDDKSTKAPREGTPPGRAGEALALEQQRTKELQDNSQRAEMYERLRYMENPLLFELCGTLFDDKKRSVWSGSHSLVQNELSTCKSTLLSAITSFMK